MYFSTGRNWLLPAFNGKNKMKMKVVMVPMQRNS